MATIISSKTSGVGGLTVTGDNSGVLQLASADGTTAVTIDASQVATFVNSPVMGVSGLTGNIAAARITTALNASGSAPVYACRAWVNFNGTGTVAIRASGNVSSITDNGVGDYTVNFTTAMPDANYAVTGTAVRDSGPDMVGFDMQTTATYPQTASSVRVSTGYNGSSAFDCGVHIVIFR